MKREVKIGIFAVAMIGVAWAGIRFLKGFDIFSRNVEYYAAYRRGWKILAEMCTGVCDYFFL